MFRSFFLAGFECATGYNRSKNRMDMICATQHDRFAQLDYRLISDLEIYGVREAIRWPIADQGRGRYDFSSLIPYIEASRRYGIEIIWDMFHYGYPDDTHPMAPDFARRFADYCYAAARWVQQHTAGVCYFTPVNEPSYLSWAGGHVGWFAPHLTGQGAELKVALCRAAIQGAEAILAACPDAVIVQADPVCRVAVPWDRPELQEEVDHFNNSVVWESLDMISGRRMPELGGDPRYLGVVGLNYYWTNQWELGAPDATPLADDDPRRRPLRELVQAAWERYGHDVMITETMHAENKRPGWIREVTQEALAMLEAGIPLQGVCLYPVLGMPEWHEPSQWARLGLWDLHPLGDRLVRVPHVPSLRALNEVQLLVPRPRVRQMSAS